jgi:hypothetical protein
MRRSPERGVALGGPSGAIQRPAEARGPLGEDGDADRDGQIRPTVGIGSLITVDTTGPVDVASVAAAEVRRLHASRTG